MVKCRPERNRNPEPDEVAACNPFLMAQLETIQPEVILTLGNFATQTLIGTKEGITKLRGKGIRTGRASSSPRFIRRSCSATPVRVQADGLGRSEAGLARVDPTGVRRSTSA